MQQFGRHPNRKLDTDIDQVIQAVMSETAQHIEYEPPPDDLEALASFKTQTREKARNLANLCVAAKAASRMDPGALRELSVITF